MKTRDLIAGRMPSGSYLEPRLSYDARRILFAFVETEGPLNPYAMCVNEEGGDDHYYHLWEIAPDDDDPAAHNDWYNSPWPYGEDLFLVSWSRDHLHYEPSRPAPDASLGSGLFGHLSRGKHANLLTSEELRMLATWIDLNATFYGCYEEPFLSRQLKGEAIPMPEHQ